MTSLVSRGIANGQNFVRVGYVEDLADFVKPSRKIDFSEAVFTSCACDTLHVASEDLSCGRQ
jgi:hypothetical protein